MVILQSCCSQCFFITGIDKRLDWSHCTIWLGASALYPNWLSFIEHLVKSRRSASTITVGHTIRKAGIGIGRAGKNNSKNAETRSVFA
jgi:hypothetical protein